MPRFNIVAGISYLFDAHRKEVFNWSGLTFPIEDVALRTGLLGSISNGELLDGVHFTLGATFDVHRSDSLDRDRLNPKLGVSWDITSGIVFRAAYIEGLKKPLIGGQTIEPTQIAGFNQIFDDPPNFRGPSVGEPAFDFKLTDRLFAGIEWSERRMKIPIFGVGGAVEEQRASEETVRSYLNWTITDRFAFSAGLQWDDLSQQTFVAQFEHLSIIRVPAEIRYYGPSGFFALLGGTFVQESGRFFDYSAFTPFDGQESFAVVNAGIGWRIPGRAAVVSLQVTNLFNSGFRFQDVDLSNPAFLPHRMILGRITFSF